MATDINELRRKISSVDIVDHIDIHANVKSTLAELLDRIEVAEKERDALRTENAGLVDDMNLLRNNNTSLRAIIEAKDNALIDWLRANAPGGWIDNLRVKCDAPGAKGEEK